MQASAAQMSSDPLFMIICFIGNSKRMGKGSNQEFKPAFFLTLSSTFSHNIMSEETKIYPDNNTAHELPNTLASLQSQLCIIQICWSGVPHHLRTWLNSHFKFILHYTGNLHGRTFQNKHYISLPFILCICLLITVLLFQTLPARYFL